VGKRPRRGQAEPTRRQQGGHEKEKRAGNFARKTKRETLEKKRSGHERDKNAMPEQDWPSPKRHKGKEQWVPHRLGYFWRGATEKKP